jgi:hypothetical protein
VLSDPGVAALVKRLGSWEKEVEVSGHNSPAFAPNILALLADMGVGAGDIPAVEKFLDQMLKHADDEGRFQSLGRWRGAPKPTWGALLCDTHAITEVLVRFGRAGDARVQASLRRMAADIADTDQGRGWPCRPDPISKFRGPGRKSEVCPHVTLEALRAFGRLPQSQRPAVVLDTARTLLDVWRKRGSGKPYMFGHGRQFKTVKWPSFWYSVYAVLEALSFYPSLRSGRAARPEDRRSLAELMACLAAYNFGPDGRVTPKSCFQNFEAYSFGQKKTPSPFATARLCAVLNRLGDLAGEARKIDILALSSSKGGAGKALPPK